MSKKTIAQIFDLTGKGAIVTGGCMGIDRAIVMRLAEAGAAVMIVDIDMDAAGNVAKRAIEKGGKAEAIKADIRSLADAKKVVDATAQDAYAGQVDRARILEGLGREFPIFIEYKPYSCARPIHNAIDCAFELKRRHHVDPAHVSKITVFRHPRWANYHGINKPRTYHEAQVSLPYAVAVSLVDGKAFLQQYTEEKMRDPLVQALCQMAEIRSVNGLPRDVSCRIEVVLKDGSQHVSQVDYPKGSIQNPMTAEEKREKFRDLSSGILGKKEQAKVESTVFGIEKLKDVSKLMALLTRKS